MSPWNPDKFYADTEPAENSDTDTDPDPCSVNYGDKNKRDVSDTVSINFEDWW
jgi:hypothetical protein